MSAETRQSHSCFKASPHGHGLPGTTPKSALPRVSPIAAAPRGVSPTATSPPRPAPGEDPHGQPGRREKHPDFIQNKTPALPGKLRVPPPLQLCQVSFQVELRKEQILLLKLEQGLPAQGNPTARPAPTHPEEAKVCHKFVPPAKGKSQKIQSQGLKFKNYIY